VCVCVCVCVCVGVCVCVCVCVCLCCGELWLFNIIPNIGFNVNFNFGVKSTAALAHLFIEGTSSIKLLYST
jgi:hypothetical protein